MGRKRRHADAGAAAAASWLLALGWADPASAAVGKNWNWIKDTTWNWNNWRHVTFQADGSFDAPTSDCQAGECRWSTNGDQLYIHWGEAGLHVLTASAPKAAKGTVISGRRQATGQPCSATFVKAAPQGEIAGGDEQSYYAALGLTKGVESTESEIKSAYRKLSRKLHPDLNPSDEARAQYEKIQEAYSVLSDRKKRKVYDIMGRDGLKQLQDAERGGGQQHHPFAAFFGGGGGGGPERGSDMHFDLRVTLDDVYNGADHVAPIEKLKLKSWDVVRKCMKCKAQPPRIQKINMMGMIMQQQVAPDCTAQCSSRSGSVRRRTEIEVNVEAGTPEGHELVFEMEADEYADRIPGDVKFSVTTAPHKTFRREGDDLHMTVVLTLLESLVGFEKEYKHMDGHTFSVAREDPTPHDFVLKIAGEGMPKHHVPSDKGDLFVHFEVAFPRTVSEQMAAEFRKLLS